MDFIEFENACAQYLRKKYAGLGYEFIVNGGMDYTAPDIKVKKGEKTICNIEVKEPNAQCSQFVAFADDETRTFTYSTRNHPATASKASLAILDAMSKNFDKHRNPSTDELGLSNQLYYDRIIDYYLNYKKCEFFMTRESVASGEFIIFPTVNFAEYFNVTACYRPKKSGSRNPNKKDLKRMPDMLKKSNLGKYEIIKDGKYINVQFEVDCTECFILEGDCRLQFKKLLPKLYRVTGLSSTNNANVIFSISLKESMKKSDWASFESKLK